MFITLEATNKKISLGQYVKAVKMALNNPEMTFNHSLSNWYPCPGSTIIKEFRFALNNRINGKTEKTRKLDENYQVSLLRDSRNIKNKILFNIRLHNIETPELYQRFSHLIYTYDDF